MEPGETDEDVANVTIEDVSDDIVRQRVDQALAREEAAAELIEVSFVHDAPDYTIELYNEGVHVCDLVAEGVFETRTQVGRCWSMRFAGQTLQEWEIAGAGLLRLNAP
jgi:regulator of replication initiation timing|tara:strand:- start:17 stop:340 length:324 start_codon:yes stop_codon:yes gene_type:complete